MRQIQKYLVIAYGFTWFCWIGAYFLSKQLGVELLLTEPFIKLFQRQIDTAFSVNLLFSIGVYGPLIAYFIVTKKRVDASLTYKAEYSKYLLIPLLLVIPTIMLSLFSGSVVLTSSIVTAFLVYFVSNIITSGTEEYGWRGFLYPEFAKTEKTLWDASWKSGLLWAVWHYPLMAIMYLPLGVYIFVSSTIGFTAGIVAMAYVLNWLYKKTGSLPLIAVFHALNNSIGYALPLIFPASPFIFLSMVTVWAAVAIIDKKEGK